MSVSEHDGIEHTDFADLVLSTAEVTRSESSYSRSNYRSLKHVAATSNVCERLFCRAKLVARDHRKHLSPYHLELFLFCDTMKIYWIHH